jgi:hypothetical protein
MPCRYFCSHLASRQGRLPTFARICVLLTRAGTSTRSLFSSRVPSPVRISTFPNANLTAHRTQSSSSPSIPAQLLFNIHQRTQFNVSQPISVAFLLIAASDARIMIRSAHSLASPSLPNFSTAHTTHPKPRFRHHTPKSVSSFFPVSCGTITE